jgi:Ca-activated chloride channel family protein
MRKALIFAAICSVVGCARPGTVPGAATAGPSALKATEPGAEPADLARATGPTAAKSPEATDGARASGAWIGASAEGEVLATETRDTFLGVWVDVPEARPETRPPMDLAIVIDTSGSMNGPKIENARAGAAMLVRNLKDGDIVSLDTFSDHARTIVSPTRLDRSTRAMILQEIAALSVNGSTNMFEGLSLAEGQLQAAPPTHSLRRVVLISDGRANIGPSTPEVLGALAERGLRNRAQITSLGVGVDYDESTLDALAVRSSGRLFHIGDAREMVSVLRGELDNLDATLASDAQIEIVPAPGVAVLGAETVRSEWQNGSLRIPLGALHSGQHREALVRVRITDPGVFEGQTRPLASVRLRFKDSLEGDLERIQETVARATLSDDADAIARGASSRAKAIVAINDAAKTQLAAAQRINDGDFMDADKELARAQASLTAQAQAVTNVAQKKRLEAAADRVATARTATRAMPSAPAAVRRDGALKVNANAMHDSGF